MWQVILCDPIWHVSSRSGEALWRTAISGYFTLLYCVWCNIMHRYMLCLEVLLRCEFCCVAYRTWIGGKFSWIYCMRLA